MTEIKPSRRQVVRAGAWTVPAIAVAVAAPAFATSGADLRPSTITSASRTGQGNTPTLTVVIHIENGGTSETTGLNVSFSAPSLSTSQPPLQNGWSLVSATITTVVYKAPAQYAAGTFQDLTFVLNRTANGTGDLVVGFNTSPGISDSETKSFT
ncbi:hypothetical protein L2K70_19905 [Nocardioides KLBMP 9356]|uniref:DUF11 domain-containing protein n=1 Tax=Nocardioides potassii TaxID=2911371 RepID=A0ABS9HH63_9ACTN|nr:hypothetical protein [Nocardioides potassii]MCF6379884.1 hypothetical protein [Nocardioides potassii]